jgi:DNA-binding MarR family transcriptional regulator
MEPGRRESLELWEDLVRAHSAILNRLEEEMETEQGLPLRWYEVQLSRAPGGRLRMQDLAQISLQSKSGLSRLVDRMEGAGLVTRESCPSDRRGVLAAITPAGRRRFRRAAPLHVRGIERHFGRHLAPAGSDALRSLLACLLEANAKPSRLPESDQGRQPAEEVESA